MSPGGFFGRFELQLHHSSCLASSLVVHWLAARPAAGWFTVHVARRALGKVPRRRRFELLEPVIVRFGPEQLSSAYRAEPVLDRKHRSRSAGVEVSRSALISAYSVPVFRPAPAIPSLPGQVAEIRFGTENLTPLTPKPVNAILPLSRIAADWPSAATRRGAFPSRLPGHPQELGRSRKR
jgi:hypothetical protein